MEVIQQRSTLNPNAPLFVPLAYRTVEDFSDQWWALVQSSPWFRDYWLQERFQDPQNDPSFSDFYDPALPDLDALLEEVEEEFEEYYRTREEFEEEEEKREWHRELVPIGALKWQKGRALAEAPRYAQKAPKIVNVKVSPRTIQQPK